jgi:hypothetical protein
MEASPRLQWDDYKPDFDDLEEERPRDAMVDTAKEALREFFERERKEVFYKRQLQVIFEDKFFHWITDRALTELAAESHVAEETVEVPVIKHITFYRATTHRFWKRQAAEITELVLRFSDPEFTKAIGAHGEQMFDAALPRFGFMPIGSKVRSFREKEWVETGHDLDRVFVRDGIAYGTEIKNTLKYIPRDEMTVKLKMCKFLGLRPLLIVRFAPKSYTFEVFEEGGFTLVIKHQLYPFGQKMFADEVKTRLRLPTDSPARINDGTIERFLKWHMASLARDAEGPVAEGA